MIHSTDFAVSLPLNFDVRQSRRESIIEVAPSFKFGLIAVPGARAGSCPLPVLQLSESFAASSALPAHALETWAEDIGRFHQDELAASGLFLWALRRSHNPDVLDQENEDLAMDVYRLYIGVLIATPYFSHDRLTRMTGANSAGTTGVRTLTTFARTYHTLGAPVPGLTVGKLQQAAALAEALRDHDCTPSSDRFDRALRSFREACESPYLDERLHKFLRCAEGFVVPPMPSGINFAERLSRVCSGRAKLHLKQMYAIRGGIEHLNGPFSRMPRRLSARGRQWRLLHRCVQAEALARYMVATYLSNPQMWPHFETRKSIDAFWKLSETEFRTLRPNKIGFDQILRDFDSKAVRAAEGR